MIGSISSIPASANPAARIPVGNRESEGAPETATQSPEKSQGGDEQRKELQEIQKLSRRDREVRAHEQAHLSVAGRYATGGASFEFKRGPDGKLYAVGGEVRIDTTPVADDPQATLEKAEVVRRAALAPRDPSPTDRQVAAQASAMAMQARAELARAVDGGNGNQVLGGLISATGATLEEPAPASVDELI